MTPTPILTRFSPICRARPGHASPKHTAGLCLSRLVEFPGIGTRRPALGPDARIGIVRPYILIYDYTAADDTLTLLRIVHGKRNITRLLLKGR